MASVSSLDKDLRNLRLDKYTPQRANEVRKWIEDVLGERLPPGDLLDALKDGTALCKLINLATPGGVKYKSSAMPFVQMENISHFLRACQSPPLSLPAHDCFLTVDLYESKDPAQVLQCIEAFSRRASAVAPATFTTAIGGRRSVVTPQGTGTSASGRAGSSFSQARTGSEASYAGGRTSPTKGATSPSTNSSWAKKSDMGSTAPAWNIAQYGWTGGASQGNQGIAFGARRQITSAAPHVPSLAEKERRRREKEEEEERLRIQAEEAERKRRVEREAEEERARAEESRRWEEETRKLKEQERRRVEEEKRRWEEQERKWKEEEEIRLREEREAEARLEKERKQKTAASDARLKGQFLSQYQADQQAKPSSESERVKELERQLEEAKERERRYERERQERLRSEGKSPGPETVAVPAPLSVSHHATPDTSLELEEDSFQQDSERDYLRKEWSSSNNQTPQRVQPSPRPLPIPNKPPQHHQQPPPSTSSFTKPSPFARPLPNPAAYAAASVSSSSFSTTTNTTPHSRTDAFLSSNPAPTPPKVSSHTPSEAAFSTTAEQDAETARRLASTTKTRAGGWASTSLLEREMELERQRQREWEESQRQTKEAASRGLADAREGSGPGQTWDVHQYGYTGGDNLNDVAKGGVYAGAGRVVGGRGIQGPRPMGGGK